MSKVVQRRRGTTAEHTTFTGELGELTVDTTKDTLVVHDGAAAGGFPLLREDGSNSALALGSAGTPSLKFTGDPNTGLYSPGADQLAVATNGTGRLFVDSSGRVLAGTSTARLYTSLGYAKFQLEGTSFADSSIGLTNNQATVDGAYLVFNKTRGTAIGSVTSVQSGDLLGSIWFEGADGTNPIRGATIEAAVDGTPGANDMPGRLVFSTAADGAATPTERLRITSAGLVGIGTSSPATALEVLGFIQTQSGAFGGGGYNIKYTSNAASRSWQLLTDNTAYGDFTIQQSTTQTGSTYTPRLYISPAGNVGIGTSSPSSVLDVVSAATGVAEFNGPANVNIALNSDTVSLKLQCGGEAVFGSTTNHPTAFVTNNTERARIDSSGRLLVGTSSARTNIDYALGTTGSQLQIEQANATTNFSIVQNFDSATTGAPATFTLARSGATSLGSSTIVANNNRVGEINFSGSDGTDFTVAACIRGEVDGTPGANDMPGRLVFSTTADGAASPTERMRIDSAGVLQVADAGNISVGTTTGTKIGTATTQKLGFYNATPVVQPAAVANATDAASVITQLNALLARMRDLGLIAT